MKYEIDDVITVTRNLQRIQNDFEMMAYMTGQKDTFKAQRQTMFNNIWLFLGVEANGKDD